jgi:hypothetical protein
LQADNFWMKRSELSDSLSGHPIIPALTESINAGNVQRIRIEGLTGSAGAMASVELIYSKTQATHVVVIPEKEDAAYFL